MNIKSIVFAAVLACTGGVGVGLSAPGHAGDLGCRSDCYDLRYECRSYCSVGGGEAACRAACDSEYYACLANC